MGQWDKKIDTMEEARKEAYEIISFVWKNLKPVFESDDMDEWIKAQTENNNYYTKIPDKNTRDLLAKVSAALQEYIGMKRREIDDGK